MSNNIRWFVLALVIATSATLRGQVRLLQPLTSPPVEASRPPLLLQAQGPAKGNQPVPQKIEANKDKGAEVLPAPRLEPRILQQLCPQSELIDLQTALQLADSQNPDIGLVRERIREAIAGQDRAHVLWLPHLDLGTTWLRHDGQVQRAAGEVLTASKSSLFVGGGPVLSFHFGNALFANLAAQQVTSAHQAGAAALTNQRLLDVALAYLDLLQAHAEIQISIEALTNAQELVRITAGWEKAEKGFAADTARARTEAAGRERDLLEAQGRARLVSTRLAQLLNLPSQLCFQPLDQAVVPLALIPEEAPLDSLLAQGLANRPEVMENRAYSQAAYERWRAAKWAPAIPSIYVGYSSGGFGGGINSFFGDFNGRGDGVAMATWHLDNLGLGNLAQNRERRSQFLQTTYQQNAVENIVARQIVEAHTASQVRRQELAVAQRAVNAAQLSFELNGKLLRKAPDVIRPIELLQAVQALARARQDYLLVVIDFNRAQFRLFTALGNAPNNGLTNASPLQLNEAVVPPKR